MGMERSDGKVYFTGGIVAHPGPLPLSLVRWQRSRLTRALTGFYDFSKKIGKSLFDVHTEVPQFNEKMLKSVERTLKRFEPHQPFERSSWEMVDDYNLYHRTKSLNIVDVIYFLIFSCLSDHIADLQDGEKLHEWLEPKDYLFRSVPPFLSPHWAFFKRSIIL